MSSTKHFFSQNYFFSCIHRPPRCTNQDLGTILASFLSLMPLIPFYALNITYSSSTHGTTHETTRNPDSTSSHVLCQFIYESNDPSRVTVAIWTYLYADIIMLWGNLGLKHNCLYALTAWEKTWHLLSVQ